MTIAEMMQQKVIEDEIEGYVIKRIYLPELHESKHCINSCNSNNSCN